MSELYAVRFALYELPPRVFYSSPRHRLPGKVSVFSRGELVPARDCWIYVFERAREPDAPHYRDEVLWTREVWVDGDGRCCLVLAGDELAGRGIDPDAQPRPLDEGGFTPLPAGELLLVDSYPDDPFVYESWIQYRFLASRRRLPNDVMRELCNPRATDVAGLEWLPVFGHLWVHPTDPRRYVGAIEPLTALEGLQDHYQAARGAWCEWEHPQLAPDAAARAKGERRQKKLFLAGAIQSLIAAHPDDGLDANLRPTAVDRVLADAKRVRDALHGASKAGNETLVTWLDSDFMRFARRALEQAGEEATIDYVDAVARGAQGLSAHEHGRAAFLRWLDDGQSWLRTYVFPEETAPADVFQVTRKAGAPILEAASEALPALALRGQGAARNVLLKLNHAAGQRVLKFEDAGAVMLLREGDVLKEVELAGGGRYTPLPTALEVWVDSPRWGARGQRALAWIGVGFELTNFVMAANDSDLTFDGVANLVGSCTDLAGAAEFLFDESDDVARRFLYINIVSGLIDTYLAVREAYSESCHADDSVVVGQALIALGAGIGVLGNVCILAGLATATGPVGWVLFGGMVLVGAGTALATFTQDTPLETFLLHCEWGTHAGRSGSTDRPTWSPVPLRDLAGDLDRQAEALFNLYANHALQAGPSERLVIRPSMLAEGAVFEVELECEVAFYAITRQVIERRKSTWRLAWLRREELTTGAPWPAGTTTRFFQHRTDASRKELHFSVDPGTTSWGGRTLRNFVEAPTWRVRLDTAGDGARFYPTYGWVEVGDGQQVDFATGPLEQSGPTVQVGWWDPGWLTILAGEDPIAAGAAFEVELQCQVVATARPVDREARTVRWRLPWRGASARPEHLSGGHWPEELLTITRDAGGRRLDFKVEGFPVGARATHLDDVVWRVRLDVQGGGQEFVPVSGFGELAPGASTPLAAAPVVHP